MIAAEGTNGGIGINAGAFFSQLISFLIVLVVLSKFVWPTVIRTLDKRKATIQEGVENAERAKEALREAGNRAEEILAEARREAQATIERAANNARQVALQIETEAHARAEQFSSMHRRLPAPPTRGPGLTATHQPSRIRRSRMLRSQ